MTTISAAKVGRRQQVRESLTKQEWRRAGWMVGTISLLHIVGFGIFIGFVLPGHYKGLGIGIAGLAYSLGLRHAFDADHIAAIDNTTRKLMNDRIDEPEPRRPLSVGYYFSLGHSTIVVAIGAGLVIAERTVFAAVSNKGSGLEQFGGIFGTLVSAAFLFLIAALNIVILAGIIRVFRSMRNGMYNEEELERQLNNRGMFFRIFGKWMKSITKEWQMYPVGVVFGLGFDTATEVSLLATTALLASKALPWYSIMCLPILFTAGMSLMDTIDSLFMNVAYSHALFNPVRRIYYNLMITGLSIFICLFIGGIELMGLLPMELHWRGSFWRFSEGFNINTAGYVIVAMFIAVWGGSAVLWRVGHIEEKWGARLLANNNLAIERDECAFGSPNAALEAALFDVVEQSPSDDFQT
jgi:high-affinity nickel-transport protein